MDSMLRIQDTNDFVWIVFFVIGILIERKLFVLLEGKKYQNYEVMIDLLITIIMHLSILTDDITLENRPIFFVNLATSSFNDRISVV